MDADAPIGVPALKALCDEMVAEGLLMKVTYENCQNGDVMHNISQMSKFWSSMKAAFEIATDCGATPAIALRDAPKGQDYNTWLHNEIYTAKRIFEDKLGIKVTGLALPYGTYSETVRHVAVTAGYQALFTLDGRHMGIDAHADNLRCYAIESNKPEILKAAMDFRLGDDNTAAKAI
jgi:hypothetical protein